MANAVAANNNTSVSGLLKRIYKDGLTVETYQNRPYWTSLTKKADSSQAVGSTFQYATLMNDIQSRNVMFGGAQSQAYGLTGYNGVNPLTNSTAGAPNAGNIGVTQWTVTRVNNYTYATISTELELSARDKKGAFEEALVTIHDSALNVLGNDQEIGLFGGSVTSTGISTAQCGFLSVIAAPTDVASSTGTLTLQYQFDCAKFSQGQELDVYYNNSGTITKRSNSTGHGLFVGSVNFSLGTLTIVNSAGTAVAINGVFSDAAVGDFLCVTNDFNYGAATGVSGTAKIMGFESYVPFGGPVSDSNSNLFNGNNRLLGNVNRNAGSWVDATGVLGPNGVLNIEDTLLAMLTIQHMVSDKKIDTFALNHNQNEKLLKSQISRTYLPGGAVQTSIPELSFEAVEVQTGMGTALIMPSRFCGVNRIFGLHMPSWFFVHLGNPVNNYDLDGMRDLREPTLDAKGSRYFSLGNVVCDNPAANVVANIAP
jgi:hypothetical protein